jgi:molybdopterin synthase sulfur carrier subunit
VSGPTIRVELPGHLRTLAGVSGAVAVEVAAPVTQRAVLDALELKYPMLRGTIRDPATMARRSFLRFFACEEDLSFQGLDALLPEAVVEGNEAFLIIGAVAGGLA